LGLGIRVLGPKSLGNGEGASAVLSRRGLQWMALVVEGGTELRCIGDAKGTGIQGRRLGAAAGHLQRRVTNKSGPHTIQVWGQLSDGGGSATTVIAE
jgi:hypothetical protein